MVRKNPKKGDKPKPGQWFNSLPKLKFPRGLDTSLRKKPKVYFSDRLVAIYTAFREQVYSPKSVLYSSCDFDASPAKVFPNVTFVDINEDCIDALAEKGFNAVNQDVREYSPSENHDLAILLNPATPPEWAAQHVASGGYILANNYHSTATEMFRQPDKYELVGTIDFVKNDKMAVVSTDLEGFFVPVKSVEEMKQLRPDQYSFIQKLIKAESLNNPNFDMDRPFEERMKAIGVGMPSRRAAEMYIFVKK